jgi:adenylosuccinate lyase
MLVVTMLLRVALRYPGTGMYLVWSARTSGQAAVSRQMRKRTGGWSDEVAWTLRRLRAARESGAAEGDVQRLARAALERGDLMVRPGAEHRQVSARMEQAVGRLVAGEQVAASRARSEGVPTREFLARAPEFDARGLQVSAK